MEKIDHPKCDARIRCTTKPRSNMRKQEWGNTQKQMRQQQSFDRGDKQVMMQFSMTKALKAATLTQKKAKNIRCRPYWQKNPEEKLFFYGNSSIFPLLQIIIYAIQYSSQSMTYIIILHRQCKLIYANFYEQVLQG